jgi:hypothetical protein
MISDVPSHAELDETATAWMNLSWEVTVRSLQQFDNIEDHLADLTEFSSSAIDTYKNDFWQRQRYQLNNSVALLQQSVELFLKARIAEVSPFLLIAGQPQSWPTVGSNGNRSFHDFRTLDATQLIK